MRFLEALGRLRDGITLAQAEEELGTIARQLASEQAGTDSSITAANLEPLDEVILGGRVRQSLVVLFGAVGLILLIACANVATLFMAKGITRGRELAIRVALGASRGRVIGQLLTESMLLAAVAGLLGILIAYLGVQALASAAAQYLPRAGEIRPDRVVLGFNLGLSLLTGILFGLIPAFTSPSSNPNQELHPGGRGHSESRRWIRSGLVVAEVALAVMLLVGAGLLLRSVWERYQVDPGFETDGLLTATLTISRSNYPERPQYLAFYRAAMERLAAHPEVVSVGSLRYFPMRGMGEQRSWEAVGEELPVPGQEREAFLLQASPGVFRTLRTPVLSGRAILATDSGSSPTVIVINRTLAERAFSTDQAAGRFLELNGQAFEVVGVVGDIRQASLEEPAPPIIYISQEQNPRRGMSFVLRGRSEIRRLIPVVREIFRELDPNRAVTEIAPAAQVLRGSVALPQLFANLLVGLAALAAVLAALGIYSLIAYSVSRRSKEIGIRMALGADQGKTRWMVISQGVRPVILGRLLGLGAAYLGGRLLANLLFGVSGSDPITYLGVTMLTVLVAIPGCLLPAYRATRIDPVDALRHE